VKDKDNER